MAMLQRPVFPEPVCQTPPTKAGRAGMAVQVPAAGDVHAPPTVVQHREVSRLQYPPTFWQRAMHWPPLKKPGEPGLLLVGLAGLAVVQVDRDCVWNPQVPLFPFGLVALFLPT